jgi:hypothetical protein
MWSDVTIPGNPSVLLIDATRNEEGFHFSNRLFSALRRAGVHLQGDSPVRIHTIEEPLNPYLSAEFNCILLLVNGESNVTNLSFKDIWEYLKKNLNSDKLLAICSWQFSNPEINQQILKASDSSSRIAIVPQSEMSMRAAGLFYLKFFTELNLHSDSEISGKMAWFSFTKARELLRKRRYSGKFGARC